MEFGTATNKILLTFVNFIANLVIMPSHGSSPPLIALLQLLCLQYRMRFCFSKYATFCRTPCTSVLQYKGMMILILNINIKQLI